MQRNSVIQKRFPAFYRYDLLVWRRETLGISIQETARMTGEKFETVRKVFMGKATSKKAYPVSQALGLDWSMVHNLELKESEFHLAVRNGRSKSAG